MTTAAKLGTWDIFIAASETDGDLARALWEGLTRAGLRPFLSAANIVHAQGVNLEPMISQALRDSELLLILVTPNLRWNEVLPLWSQVSQRKRGPVRIRALCVYTDVKLMAAAPHAELRRHALELGAVERRAQVYQRIFAYRHPAAQRTTDSSSGWLWLLGFAVLAALVAASR